MAETLSRAQARRLFVRTQGLDGDWPPLSDNTPSDGALSGSALSGSAAVARTVARLGYVQIDTIAVVERAHHHTLWARQPDYRPEDLHQAQAHDRSVFEAWYPVASYVPMPDYRYALPSMQQAANWRAPDAAVREAVLDRIRKEGALGSADFEAPPDFTRKGWWSWKPAKSALEHLFASGELMVSERRNFQRLYDLRERVLPAGIDTTYPTHEELGLFFARQALAAMGVAGVGNSRWRGTPRTLLGKGLRALAESGEAVPVTVEGIAKGAWYAAPAAVQGVDAPAAERPAEHPRVHILSPFDSLVIHRAWLKALFDFDYTIECYVPAAKRQCGYFCLPVLWGDRMVARMDAKADRAAATLRVITLRFEPEVVRDGVDDALAAALAQTVWAFAAFNGCTTIDVQAVAPEAFRAPLVAAVAGERGNA